METSMLTILPEKTCLEEADGCSRALCSGGLISEGGQAASIAPLSLSCSPLLLFYFLNETSVVGILEGGLLRSLVVGTCGVQHRLFCSSGRVRCRGLCFGAMITNKKTNKKIQLVVFFTYRIGCPFLFPGLLPAPARKSFSTFEMGGRVGFP